MNLSLCIDIDRREGLYLLVKTFLAKSVVMRGAVPHDLDRIDALLCGCVRDRALVIELDVWYLSTPVDAEVVEKEGQALFSVDWGYRKECSEGGARWRSTGGNSSEDPVRLRQA